MDLGLAGKVAVVTGASRGIGRAIATTLAREGMKLALTARSEDTLRELARSLPPESLVVPFDLREPAAAATIVAAALERFGRLDLLVNNAGATKRGDFLELTDADWHDGFALKFFGAMRLTRAAWPSLVASRGSIVNIIGVGGRTGDAEFAIGGSVNAALRLFTKALADRGVTDGVRVNAINPGLVKTERLTLRLEGYAREHGVPATEAALASNMRIARFGEPREIAAAVAFLASASACGYCNGALLDIDGGQTRTL